MIFSTFTLMGLNYRIVQNSVPAARDISYNKREKKITDIKSNYKNEIIQMKKIN